MDATQMFVGYFVGPYAFERHVGFGAYADAMNQERSSLCSEGEHVDR